MAIRYKDYRDIGSNPICTYCAPSLYGSRVMRTSMVSSIRGLPYTAILVDVFKHATGDAYSDVIEYYVMGHVDVNVLSGVFHYYLLIWLELPDLLRHNL